MNTEQKAKAYDEVLDRAKKELQTCGSTDCDAARQIFKFFPTLRESKDERIRKEIIDFIQWAEDRGMTRHDYHQAKRPAVWIAYLEKQKECVVDNNKTSAEEDERIRARLIEYFQGFLEGYEDCYKDGGCVKWEGLDVKSILAYLEKQKDERELGYIEGKVEGVRQTCQEIKDAMSLFEPKDLTPFEFTFRNYIDSAIRYCLSGEGYQQYIKEWSADLLNLEKQKEQKSNIELIQKSWYMEGYHDKEFNCEPKWIIKTGEGGPRYEENPKYGQIIKQKPVEYLSKDKVYAIMNKLTELSTSELIPLNSDEYKKINEITSDVRSLLDYPIEQKPRWKINNPHTTKWTKEMIDEKFEELVEEYHKQKPVVTHGETYHVDTLGTQQVIAGKMPQKSAEWSEEDEKMIERLITRLNWITYNTRTDGTSPNITFFDKIEWLKSLRPYWKPSEEQMEALKCAVADIARFSKRGGRQVELENEPYYSALHSLYCNLEKLM